MEKVNFRNSTNFNIKIFSEGKGLPLYPSQEDWLVFSAGLLDIEIHSRMYFYQKRKEKFQIEIKEGHNFIEVFLDEMYFKYSRKFRFPIFWIFVLINAINQDESSFFLRVYNFKLFGFSWGVYLLFILSIIDVYFLIKAFKCFKELEHVFIVENN